MLWLRPAYQLERSGVELLGGPAEPSLQIEAALSARVGRKPAFPRDALPAGLAMVIRRSGKSRAYRGSQLVR